ncbi:uncharacterized protein LOC112004569 isoform X2 [Quercus suber]|uniref:uncharacterized protein LOC112004569 isoform X2 n=1 Tax=Quercus suber TaxID=58331 RepID=UPI0032E0519B
MKVKRRKWKSRGLICGFGGSLSAHTTGYNVHIYSDRVIALERAPKILKVRIVQLDENGDVVDLDKDNELLPLISRL